MRTRDYVQEYQQDLGTSGTKTYSLDVTDPISEIDILIAGTNGASGNVDNPLEGCVSKIEVVDGGEVLWDLPGDIALAAFSHFNNGVPHSYRSYQDSEGVYQAIPIRFGRYPYDPLFSFNPSAHKNPQLKITFDEAAVRAAGATGYVSDSMTLTLMLKIMEQSEPPVGFLSCKEVELFTSVASGDKLVEIPTDRVIRAMLIRAYESGIDLRSSLTNYKLSIDSSKYVPFDLYAAQAVDKMCEFFKPLDLALTVTADDATAYQTYIGIDLGGVAGTQVGGSIIGCAGFWPGQALMRVNSHAGLAETNRKAQLLYSGWAMHNLVIYPFGRLDSPEDWLNLADVRKLDLILTQGNAGAECEIAVQSVYPY